MTKYIITFDYSTSNIGALMQAYAGSSNYVCCESKESMEDYLSEHTDLKNIRVYKIETEFKINLGKVELKEVK